MRDISLKPSSPAYLNAVVKLSTDKLLPKIAETKSTFDVVATSTFRVIPLSPPAASFSQPLPHLPRQAKH